MRYSSSGSVRYVPVAGIGFTPAQPQGVTLTWSNGDLAGSADVSAAGGFFDRFLGPSPLIGSHVGFQRTYGLKAVDGTDGSVTASTRITLIHAGLTARPNRTRPRGRKTYRFYGFPTRKPIYAHYFYGGRLRRTIYMGRAQRACGKLTRRLPLIPYGTRVRLGTWKIYFSNRKRYTKRSTLLIYPFEIFRTFHF